RDVHRTRSRSPRPGGDDRPFIRPRSARGGSRSIMKPALFVRFLMLVCICAALAAVACGEKGGSQAGAPPQEAKPPESSATPASGQAKAPDTAAPASSGDTKGATADGKGSPGGAKGASGGAGDAKAASDAKGGLPPAVQMGAENMLVA